MFKEINLQTTHDIYLFMNLFQNEIKLPKRQLKGDCKLCHLVTLNLVATETTSNRLKFYGNQNKFQSPQSP